MKIQKIVSTIFFLASIILSNPSYATLVMVYEAGEVTTFDKVGDVVIVRQCKSPALKKAIESPSGCPIKEGSLEARFEGLQFLQHIQEALSFVNAQVTDLSSSEKLLLTNGLVNITPYNNVSEFDGLKKQLARLEEFSKENELDHDVVKLAQTRDLVKQLTINFGAQAEIGKIINSLLQVMTSGVEGSIIHLTLRNSSDRDQIRYQVLKRIADLYTNPKLTFENCGSVGSLIERVTHCGIVNKTLANVQLNKSFWRLVTWFNGQMVWLGPSGKLYTVHMGVDPNVPGTMEWVAAHCSSIHKYVPEVYGIPGVTWNVPESTTLISDFGNGINLPIGVVADWIWLSNRTRWKDGQIIDHSGYAGALCQGNM